MRLPTWLQRLFGRNRETDLADEIEAHLALETQQRLERNEPPEEVRDRALRDFGSIALAKERTRDTWGFGGFQAFRDDLRFGLRFFAKHKLLTCTVWLTLALGTGALTAAFGVVEAMLLRSLPYPGAGRLYHVLLHPEAGEQTGSQASESAPSAIGRLTRGFSDHIRNHARTLESVSIHTQWMGVMNSGGAAERIMPALVSPEFFSALGVQPALGRPFTRQEMEGSNPRVCLLSYEYWQSRFGGRHSVVGEPVTIDGEPYTVVGIMPRDFRVWLSGLTASPQVYLPVSSRDGQEFRRNPAEVVIVKLSETVSVDAATQELNTLLESARAEEEDLHQRRISHLSLMPVADEVASQLRPMLYTILGLCGCLYLIACMNLAGLMLAQTAARARELGIRRALGATRLRVAWQLLSECVLLALPGGVLGGFAAIAAARLTASLYPGTLPRADLIGFHPAVLLFSITATLVGGILVGMLPAWRFSTENTLAGGRSLGSGATATPSRGRMLDVLVCAQVTLAVAVLVCSALFLESFHELRSVQPGYQLQQRLTAQVILPQASYADAPSRARFTTELLERLRAIPGVQRAAITSSIPLNLNASYAAAFSIPGKPEFSDQRIAIVFVSSQYFEALGIPLLSGVPLDGEQHPESKAAIVSEAFARKYFASANPVGETLLQGTDPLRITGVVADHRSQWLVQTSAPEIYRPLLMEPKTLLDMVLLTGGDPHALVPSLREAVAAIDPMLAVGKVSTMEKNFDNGVAPLRFRALLTGSLTAIAVVLALLGVYAVVAWVVRARIPEYGVRMALGARPRDILAQVMRRGIRLPAAGVILGIPLGYVLARLIESELYGVEAAHLNTYLLVAGIMLVVIAGAAAIPALRAARVSPLEALRHE